MIERNYRLTIRCPDEDNASVLYAASVFEHAAWCLRNEAGGGTVVSHEKECYGTLHATLGFTGSDQ